MWSAMKFRGDSQLLGIPKRGILVIAKKCFPYFMCFAWHKICDTKTSKTHFTTCDFLPFLTWLGAYYLPCCFSSKWYGRWDGGLSVTSENGDDRVDTEKDRSAALSKISLTSQQLMGVTLLTNIPFAIKLANIMYQGGFLYGISKI